jgi:hypothetical protein
MADISSQALQELRQQLNAAVAQAASAPTIAAVTPADFCTAYKTAKPILQTAVTLLPIFLPGIGTTISAAITALIAVADKACPTS